MVWCGGREESGGEGKRLKELGEGREVEGKEQINLYFLGSNLYSSL